MDTKSRLRELVGRSGVADVSPSALTAALVVCVVVVAAAVWYWWPSPSDSDAAVRVEASAARVEQTNGTAIEGVAGGSSGVASGVTTDTVCVHLVGAVHRPGVYRLQSGARISDAIGMAGGLLGSAEERAVNLARVLVDGEQVLILTKDEYASSGSAGTPGAQSGSPAGFNPESGSAGETAPVDINSADATALETLPGIGPATAARILADREANGPFTSPEDLARVSGIGDKKLEALSGLIIAR